MTRSAGWRRRVRLSRSDRLPAPIAFGILRPEICVPSRVLHGLNEAQQDCVLAHELAHLVRRDPAWLALLHLVERVLFVQPLNHVAVRRLREVAEYCCDAWAVERTGDRLTLARCLTEVAGWFGPSRPAPVRVTAMAGSPSSLARRVGRLLDEAPVRAAKSRPIVAAVGLFVVLAVVTATAPGIGVSKRDAWAAEPFPASRTRRRRRRMRRRRRRLHRHRRSRTTASLMT